MFWIGVTIFAWFCWAFAKGMDGVATAITDKQDETNERLADIQASMRNTEHLLNLIEMNNRK